MGFSTSSSSKAVGQELAAVLPRDTKSWYQRGHLVKLNLLILSLAQLSSCNGYDGSIMVLSIDPQNRTYADNLRTAY